MHEPVLRRQVMRWGAFSATGLVWSGAVEATAECDETEDNIEGPYYKAGAPERDALLEKGMPGIRLEVRGRVLNTRCEPIPNAILDVWHCDDKGAYDNTGYVYRGRIQADRRGNYVIRTIVPPPYKVSETSTRPAHLHLKLSGKDTKLLTTQLYFKGDRFNTVDRAYRKSLEINPVDDGKGGRKANFDFHLKTA
ncbi:MAG: intradiol ring-cleavage dioxygenase [Bryobacteraceae bacterium]